jgi:predicted RNA-binding Zn-ribbon protein involved in translation (DUF1610 family)
MPEELPPMEKHVKGTVKVRARIETTLTFLLHCGQCGKEMIHRKEVLMEGQWQSLHVCTECDNSVFMDQMYPLVHDRAEKRYDSAADFQEGLPKKYRK